MNDSIYEEYMRNVLGYQPINTTYDMNYSGWEMPSISAMNNLQIQELENCYPDIYKIVYPMVQKACSRNTSTINNKLIDSMTDEIYYAVEDRKMQDDRSKAEKQTKEVVENRQSEVRNQGLNDLIRILILRELLGKPGFPGNKPPQPRPPRPPMRPPMGPQRPQPRPGIGPFNRNTFGDYSDLYEY